MTENSKLKTFFIAFALSTMMAWGNGLVAQSSDDNPFEMANAAMFGSESLTLEGPALSQSIVVPSQRSIPIDSTAYSFQTGELPAGEIVSESMPSVLSPAVEQPVPRNPFVGAGGAITAPGILGGRTQQRSVLDSHDRFANQETSHLLQGQQMPIETQWQLPQTTIEPANMAPSMLEPNLNVPSLNPPLIEELVPNQQQFAQPAPRIPQPTMVAPQGFDYQTAPRSSVPLMIVPPAYRDGEYDCPYERAQRQSQMRPAYIPYGGLGIESRSRESSYDELRQGRGLDRYDDLYRSSYRVPVIRGYHRAPQPEFMLRMGY